MFNLKARFLSNGRRINGFELPLAGLLVMLGISVGNASTIAPISLDDTATSSQVVADAAPVDRMSDGVYLYGQSSQAEQIGQEYLVFEVRGGRAIGAVYMPQSEFSCFSGTLRSRQLDLMVMNPYPETADSEPPEARPYQEVAAVSNDSTMIGYESIAYPFSVKLQEYQPIAKLSQNDRRLLGVCKAQYQQQGWSR